MRCIVGREARVNIVANITCEIMCIELMVCSRILK